jgi:hypothetical protein
MTLDRIKDAVPKAGVRFGHPPPREHKEPRMNAKGRECRQGGIEAAG